MGILLSRFHVSILFAVFTLAAAASSQSIIFQTPLSPRIANYDIGVRYEPSEHTLDGHETLSWRNVSSDIIHHLEMHLYLNAFRNDRSTFLRESGGNNRGSSLDKDGWGFTEIRSMRLSTGEDLTRAYRFIHPDDDNADDRTVIDVQLPRSVAPGESLKVLIDFFAKLPQPPMARSGAKAEYAFVGQWFPKIGVYENGNWNCHQYHALSEFFADFGVYNVRMTVPEKNLVGATGLEVQTVKNGDGTATHWFHAEDVHDFSWTTSPEFVEFTGRSENVDIRVLMQPDHRDQGLRHVAAAATAIKYFHDWYGVYPFPNLTVVDPRRGAPGSGGMEYPTLITAGTIYGLPDGIHAVEVVIVHEFGHNYWYHLLASNEFEESWKVIFTEVKKGKGYDFNLTTSDPSFNADSGSSDRNDSTKVYLSEVDVRRLGTFTFPVTVEVVFENGEKLREQWDGRELWKKYNYLRPAKLVSATVDPDHLIPLDVNLTNNSKTLETQQLGITKTAIRVLFWVQSLIDQPELLNMINFINGIF